MLRLTLLVYNTLFPFVFLAQLPGYLGRMIRRGNYRAKFAHRLGRYSAEEKALLARPGADCIWIYSISVGETLVALKLARTLHASTGCRIVLSTTTSTGFALAQEAASEWLHPIYNPLDFLPIVRRALATISPRLVVFIEGGLWPNFLAHCRRRQIPIVLADARLSPRSEKRFRRFRFFTAPLFQMLDLITVPLAQDVERWASLGVPKNRIQPTGSIKFDSASSGAGESSRRVEDFRALIQTAGLDPTRPIIVAGSTHAGEELILARLLPALRERSPGVVLFIAPRHIERAPAILRELEPLGLRLRLRSTLGNETPDASAPDILLLDSTGELRDWYALASAVFVGKSLTSIGGQNPAEPALLGKPVVFGPHMENFAALVAHLLNEDAAIQVADERELTGALQTLLQDEPRRIHLARRAVAALSAHQGATSRATQAVAALLPA